MIGRIILQGRNSYWPLIRFFIRLIIWVVALFTLLALAWTHFSASGSTKFVVKSLTRGYYLDVKHKISNAAISNLSFEEALASVAKHKTIILAMVDDSQELPVRNFYHNSILPFGLLNTLFVSTSRNGCHRLLVLDIPCVVYGDSPGGAAIYNTPKFIAKMNVRTNYTLRALQLGYSILQTDTDVVYYKDPFPYFNCTECHIEAMENGRPGIINAGFVYIRASNVTVDAYRAMIAMSKRAPRTDDQSQLNSIVRAKNVKHRLLDSTQFPCGLDYYSRPQRYFKSSARGCPGCVVVHNNYIISTEAKIYRFKEMGQWNVDVNGYYSDVNAKYVTYRDTSCGRFFNDGKHALTNALAIARILDRTLILPKFQHTNGTYCALHCYVRIRDFDNNFDYRESEFLNHPLVPAHIVKSEAVYIVPTSIISAWQSVDDLQVLIALGKINSSVIHMGKALSDITVTFKNKEEQHRFDKRVKSGMRPIK